MIFSVQWLDDIKYQEPTTESHTHILLIPVLLWQHILVSYLLQAYSPPQSYSCAPNTYSLRRYPMFWQQRNFTLRPQRWNTDLDAHTAFLAGFPHRPSDLCSTMPFLQWKSANVFFRRLEKLERKTVIAQKLNRASSKKHTNQVCNPRLPLHKKLNSQFFRLCSVIVNIFQIF